MSVKVMNQKIKRNCNALLFYTDDLSGKRLVCHLHDFDQFVKSEMIGTLSIRVNSLPANEPVSLQKPIDKYTGDDHKHDEVVYGVQSQC